MVTMYEFYRADDMDADSRRIYKARSGGVD